MPDPASPASARRSATDRRGGLVVCSQLFGLAALAVVVTSLLPPYQQYWIGYISCLVIVTVGLSLLVGGTGLFTIASAAFLGFGAYGVYYLYVEVGVPIWLAVPLVTVAAWLLGWSLGLASLRLSGFYLALVTLGFLMVFTVVIQQGGSITGGGYGLIAPPASIFGARIGFAAWADWAVGSAAFSVVLGHHLLRSRQGRAWRAIKHNETMAELCGVRLVLFKTGVFALSSALAAYAGTLYLFIEGAASPSSFGITTSIQQLAYTIVGGVGSMAGAVVGPVVLVLVPEAFRFTGVYAQLVYGGAILLVLAVAPTGLVGLAVRGASRLAFVERLRRRARERARRLPVAPLLPDRLAPGPAPRPTSLASRREPVAMDGVSMLEFRGVSVDYGGLRAVSDLSMTLRQGEVRGLIGANGAGKTTAMNAISGLARVSDGSIVLLGDELHSPRRRTPRARLQGLGIARTYQTPLVSPTMSAAENVLVGMHPQLKATSLAGSVRLARTVAEERGARDRAFELLERVEFGADPDLPASALTFGQIRKLEIARALAQRPRLLLLDEPTSGLELPSAIAMIELLCTLRERSADGLTLLIVEHNVPLVFGYCDRLTVMEQGRLIVTGEPDEVRSHDDVRRSFLGGHESRPVSR